jgi:hypothetical protein
MFNRVLRWPSFWSTAELEELVSLPDTPKPLPREVVHESFVRYSSELFAGCASELLLLPVRKEWSYTVGKLKRAMPPSLKRRTQTVDSRGSTWGVIARYMSPIVACLPNDESWIEPTMDAEEVATGLYSLVLVSCSS